MNHHHLKVDEIMRIQNYLLHLTMRELSGAFGIKLVTHRACEITNDIGYYHESRGFLKKYLGQSKTVQCGFEEKEATSSLTEYQHWQQDACREDVHGTFVPHSCTSTWPDQCHTDL